jgi:hypothetical protein
MQKSVSFTRHVNHYWLDQTAHWVASEIGYTEINNNIEKLLEQSIRTKENRRKARNLLTSLWKNPTNVNFQKFALNNIRQSDEINLAVHWGILISRKPFFADVARFIGRTCKLNDSFSYAQVKKRITELYGETESAKRGLRAVLKTMGELGVLERVDGAIYNVRILQNEVPPELRCWLILAAMIGENVNSRLLSDSLDDAIWFPFDFDIQLESVDKQWFELHQQGHDIMLFRK